MKIPFNSWWCILIGGIIVFGLALTSCQSATPSASGKKSIVVTYSVLGSLVKDLVGDQANVTVTIPNGLDPHEFVPSAKDIEAINKANLVIQNGLGLEGSLVRTLSSAESNGVKIFTATDHIIIRHVGQGEGIPSGDPDQAVGAADPHFWMDPVSMKSVIADLAAELKKDFNLDLSVQGANLESRLDDLNNQVAGMISTIPPVNRKLVTGHESMGYFAQRYKFKLIGVIIPSLTSQAGTSPSDLAQLKKAIEDNKVKAIFTEVGTPPAVANTIGNETGVKVIELMTHALPPDGSYFTFMTDAAKVITDGLK
jgi:zinc/manganese transport system substrate-binding protein